MGKNKDVLIVALSTVIFGILCSVSVGIPYMILGDFSSLFFISFVLWWLYNAILFYVAGRMFRGGKSGLSFLMIIIYSGLATVVKVGIDTLTDKMAGYLPNMLVVAATIEIFMILYIAALDYILFLKVGKRKIKEEKEGLDGLEIAIGSLGVLYAGVMIFYAVRLGDAIDRFGNMAEVREIGLDNTIWNYSTILARRSSTVATIVYVGCFIIIWCIMKRITFKEERPEIKTHADKTVTENRNIIDKRIPKNKEMLPIVLSTIIFGILIRGLARTPHMSLAAFSISFLICFALWWIYDSVLFYFAEQMRNEKQSGALFLKMIMYGGLAALIKVGIDTFIDVTSMFVHVSNWVIIEAVKEIFLIIYIAALILFLFVRIGNRKIAKKKAGIAGVLSAMGILAAVCVGAAFYYAPLAEHADEYLIENINFVDLMTMPRPYANLMETGGVIVCVAAIIIVWYILSKITVKRDS